jgi:hypothetical protein
VPAQPYHHIGYFCPSPRKVPNADSAGTFDKTCFLFKVSAPERRRTGIPARFSTDPTGEMSKVTARRLIEKR